MTYLDNKKESGLPYLSFKSIGEAWLDLNRKLYSFGQEINNEILEIRHVNFEILNPSIDDAIIKKFGNETHIINMRKVFNTDEENIFGHSYKKLIKGPKGCNDFSDVTDMLLKDVHTKKAAAVLISTEKKVPCIQSIHFLIRDGKLEVSYFSRAQDAYKKLYADIIVILEFAEKIAKALNTSVSSLHASIISLHIYNEDLNQIKDILEKSNQGIK